MTDMLALQYSCPQTILMRDRVTWTDAAAAAVLSSCLVASTHQSCDIVCLYVHRGPSERRASMMAFSVMAVIKHLWRTDARCGAAGWHIGFSSKRLGLQDAVRIQTVFITPAILPDTVPGWETRELGRERLRREPSCRRWSALTNVRLPGQYEPRNCMSGRVDALTTWMQIRLREIARQNDERYGY